METPQKDPTIDEYLRKRLMPVEGAIPHLAGIEMYGNSIPAGTVGGDLFEYINFQQRYNIDARIARALKLSTGSIWNRSPRASLREIGGCSCAVAGIEAGLQPGGGCRVQKGEEPPSS